MSDLSNVLARLEAACTKLESLAGASGSAGASASSGDASGPALEAYDEFIAEHVDPYVSISAQIGGEIAEHAQLVKATFAAQRSFVAMAMQSKEPADMTPLLKPLSDALGAVVAFKDASKDRDVANHLTAVADSIPAIGWVQVKPKPSPFVKQMSEAGDFYADRVIKQFKDSDKTQVEWARAWKGVWPPLAEYVRKYHTTGVAWNPNGQSAAAPPSAAPPAKGPPGPPPPAPTAAQLDSSSGKGGKASTAALFAELQKGEGVTAGLKKVDKSMMTHKNPELRGSSTVPASEKKAPATASSNKWGGAKKKGNPTLELQGKKWVVEHQEDRQDLVISDTRDNQTIYIYNCNNSVIQVKSKVNAITLDGCKKVAVVFESVVSLCEVLNCQDAKIQVLQTAPTINVEKTDGIQIFLGAHALDTEIVTAKCSEMNVSVPGATPEDDLVEHPLPEQYKTTFNQQSGKFDTVCLAHSG